MCDGAGGAVGGNEGAACGERSWRNRSVIELIY